MTHVVGIYSIAITCGWYNYLIDDESLVIGKTIGTSLNYKKSSYRLPVYGYPESLPGFYPCHHPVPFYRHFPSITYGPLDPFYGVNLHGAPIIGPAWFIEHKILFGRIMA